jgi:hypothetical protein
MCFKLDVCLKKERREGGRKEGKEGKMEAGRKEIRNKKQFGFKQEGIFVLFLYIVFQALSP